MKKIEAKFRYANNAYDDLILIGDNYLGLTWLNSKNKEYEVQYIDPPYNNGNGSLKYKDNHKHDVWAKFMKVRLEIAYKLMTSDGVIFISIDDNEYARLKLLCDSIFVDCTCTTLIWQCKHTVSNDLALGITCQTEYILCYSKPDFSARRFSLKGDYVNKAYRYDDKNGKGKYRTVPMYKKKAPLSYTVTSPTGKVWSLGWNFIESEFKRLNAIGDVYWGKDGTAQPQKKVYLSKNKGAGTANLLLGDKVGYTGDGTKDLRKWFPSKNVQYDFVYPKPVNLMKYLINLHPKNDISVIDWFAGSGTTQEAVSVLAHENKSNIKSTMICLDENKIDLLCIDRVSAVCKHFGRTFSIADLITK